MARPQSPEYDQRRQSILDRAAVLFSEQGFHSASMAQIARDCDVSKALLYHYFRAKEDILFAVMEDHIRLLLDTAGAAVEEPLPAADRLRVIARDYLDIYRHSQARHVVLLNELKSLEPDQAARIVRMERDILDIFGALIGEIGGGNLSRKADRAVATRLFMGMINWTYTWYDEDGPLSAEDIADMATGIFIAGLEKGDFGGLEARLSRTPPLATARA